MGKRRKIQKEDLLSSLPMHVLKRVCCYSWNPHFLSVNRKCYSAYQEVISGRNNGASIRKKYQKNR